MSPYPATRQNATWTAIKSGWGQQMPFRMLALSDQQRQDLSKAKRTYRRQRASASSGEERNAARTTWQAALAGILTTDQKTIVSSYESNYDSASANVAGGFDAVLTTSDG